MNKLPHPLPAAFAAPAQELLYKRYGDPRVPAFEPAWMTLWAVRDAFPWFPQARIYVHRDFKAALIPAFTALQNGGHYREIKTFDGCFNIRHVRGSYSVLSVHSWGAAIDLNAWDNPMATAGKWTAAFIRTMQAHRIYCGQSWTGRKDPMHFALVNG